MEKQVSENDLQKNEIKNPGVILVPYSRKKKFLPDMCSIKKWSAQNTLLVYLNYTVLMSLYYQVSTDMCDKMRGEFIL